MREQDLEAARRELDEDRRAERRLVPQALVALACVIVLVLVREWLLA